MKLTITNEIANKWIVDETDAGLYGELATFDKVTDAIEYMAQRLGYDFGRDPWIMDEKDIIGEQ